MLDGFIPMTVAFPFHPLHEIGGWKGQVSVRMWSSPALQEPEVLPVFRDTQTVIECGIRRPGQFAFKKNAFTPMHQNALAIEPTYGAQSMRKALLRTLPNISSHLRPEGSVALWSLLSGPITSPLLLFIPHAGDGMHYICDGGSSCP